MEIEHTIPDPDGARNQRDVHLEQPTPTTPPPPKAPPLASSNGASPDHLEHALQYARHGWPVIPLHHIEDGHCSCGKGIACKSPGKHPRTRNGFKDASMDEDTLRNWWTKWPSAHVGVCTGAASGLLVVDIDPRNGGNKTLADLIARHGQLPTTPTVLTGGGGKHIYFRHPGKPVKSKSHAWGTGIDLKADDGYVVAPPSGHVSGQQYRWLQQHSPSDLELAAFAASWLTKICPADGGNPTQSMDGAGEAPPCHRPNSFGRLTDEQVISSATDAKNGEKFFALWSGKTDGYPSQSEADLALVNHLAFWCEGDRKQIDRTFRLSGLMRPKWNEIHFADGRTYGQNTIDVAIESRTGVFTGTAPGRNGKARTLDEQAIQNLESNLASDPEVAARNSLEDQSITALAVLRTVDRPRYERFIRDLEVAGIKVKECNRIDRAVSSRIRAIKSESSDGACSDDDGAATEREQPKIIDLVPGKAPIVPEAIEPRGWSIGSDGIGRDDREGNKTQTARIIPTPIIITHRSISLDDGRESVGLAFFRDSKWKQITAPRNSIADKRELIRFADHGIQVHSGNSGELVQYLADFEEANIAVTPIHYVSSQMGWKKYGFLWGSNFIDATPVTAAPWAKSAERQFVKFRGDDDGDEILAKGMRPRGSLQGWIDAFRPAAAYPVVMVAVYSAFVPPLLDILGVPNFGVDLCGYSSTGKTTVQRIAASVWGDPDDRNPGSVLKSWDATPVYIERVACTQSFIPLILDDTKKANNKRVLSRVVYNISGGQGKGRGSVSGTRVTRTFHTVLLSSGEESLVAHTQDGGAHARVLTLWGMPFGRANSTTAQVVSGINQGVRENFGHACPVFVKYVQRLRPCWKEWSDWFRRIVLAKYVSRAAQNPILIRYAEYLAIIEVAARTAHRALCLPWRYTDPIEAIWKKLSHEAANADRATAALRHVKSWMHSNMEAFHGRERRDVEGQPFPPSQGWAGQWKQDSSHKTIEFHPNKLEKILEDAEFDRNAILRTWKDRGWLETNSTEKRLTKKMRIHGEIARVIAIKRSVIDAV